MCALSANWPRQGVAVWLAEHHGNLGSVDICQVKQSDASLKRRTSVRAYLAQRSLTPWLEPYEHFALSTLDSGYPDWLRTIPDPPPVLLCPGKRTALDQQVVAVVEVFGRTTYGFRVGQGSC